MGNGAFISKIQVKNKFSFNTLWEMEPKTVTNLRGHWLFQYPMGNGAFYQDTRLSVGHSFNTLWEMEPCNHRSSGG